jgi:hypothetical protein
MTLEARKAPSAFGQGLTRAHEHLPQRLRRRRRLDEGAALVHDGERRIASSTSGRSDPSSLPLRETTDAVIRGFPDVERLFSKDPDGSSHGR